MAMIRVASLAIVLGLTGCARDMSPETLVPRQEAAYAEQIVARLRERQLEPIESAADPSLRSSKLRGQLEQMAALFPASQPADIEMVGANIHTFEDGLRVVQTFNLTYQIRFADRWVVAGVGFRKIGEERSVTSLSVHRNSESLEEMNRFGFRGKGVVHYLVLGLAVLIPCFVLVSVVLCLLTPMRRRWAWILFVLIGIGRFTFNWTDGSYSLSLLGFQLLGAGFTSFNEYSPMLLSVSAPVGAFIFLLRRSALAAEARSAS